MLFAIIRYTTIIMNMIKYYYYIKYKLHIIQLLHSVLIHKFNTTSYRCVIKQQQSIYIYQFNDCILLFIILYFINSKVH